MASKEVIELDVLLAPIHGDVPTGIDLRTDSDPASNYYKLKDARSAARAKERNVEAEGEEVDLLPEWRTILELAPKVLAEQAKDLEVTAWLIEALVRRHGFAGLRDGFRLAGGLVSTFWDGLFPLADEDGVATKVAPLTALNGSETDGTLIQPIRKVPVTQPGDHGPYASWHYEQAINMADAAGEEARAWRLEAGTVTMDQIKEAQRTTKPKFYVDLVDDLRECQEAFTALNAALDAACGSDAPPSSNIRNALEAVATIARTLGADALAAAEGAAALDAGTASGDGAAQESGQGVGSGPIGSREQAFKTLSLVAEYFRRSEPHSPISYTLDELVRRGRMTLPELLNELISDAVQRRSFYVVAGMKPPEEPQQ